MGTFRKSHKVSAVEFDPFGAKFGLNPTWVLMAWKFNSKQLLSKTLNSRMNIIETRAVLNVIRKGGM